jgi:hypothetical protein
MKRPQRAQLAAAALPAWRPQGTAPPGPASARLSTRGRLGGGGVKGAAR